MQDRNFQNHGLPPELVRALESMKFEQLTPIQAQSFPVLRAGKDLIGQSQTGSGKTIAFGLPLIEKIKTESRTLQGLVLCPTRELCDQVAHTLRSAGRFKKDLLIATLVGGEPMYLQVRSLKHGVHIAVGTPGRIIDLMERQKLDFSSLHTVVLDEADRMLDMGFRESIEKVLETAPKNRQTALFSATFPPTIEALSQRFQRKPERIEVEVDAADKPAIDQFAYCVPEEAREKTLVKLLLQNQFESALIFCNLKTSVDTLTAALQAAGIPADKIHGDLEQVDRNRVMAKFRNGTVRILVATDVAARGLDVAGIDAVLNFEMAKDPQTHVHRIGRTGRAGKTGVAISLWTSAERHKLLRIAEFTGKPLPESVLSRGRELQDSPNVKVRKLDTIEISGGRKDKLRAGDILGALTGEGCGLPGTDIGKIEIKDHISYVAIESSVVRQAMRGLQQGKIKNRRFFVRLVSGPGTVTPSTRPRHFDR